MPKPCTGGETNNADLIKESRAFCEGLQYRASGSQAARPFSDNPHPVGSYASEAWGDGWFVAAGSSGGTIPASEAPCCAVPHNVILA